MNIIFVDDEQSAHINFSYSIKDRTDIASASYFFDINKALSYALQHKIDCACLDLDLIGGNGIDLAKKLKQIQPDIELVFITSHDEFAREAYRVGGRGYLSKPYSEEEFDEVMTRVSTLVKPPTQSSIANHSPAHLYIFAKTFGNFDLQINGRTIHFKSSKAKELLAFLINQIGGTVSSAQIFFALWERQEYSQTTSTYVRRTIRSLKNELENEGIAHILVSKRNSICIDVNAIDCDYYSLINGDTRALYTFNSQYMSQYSWGEETIPVIERLVKNLKKN